MIAVIAAIVDFFFSAIGAIIWKPGLSFINNLHLLAFFDYIYLRLQFELD